MNSRITTPKIHHNVGCLCCKTVEKEMVRIGPMVFCNICFRQQFKTDDPINKEKAFYSAWLNRYKEEHTS